MTGPILVFLAPTKKGLRSPIIKWKLSLQAWCQSPIVINLLHNHIPLLIHLLKKLSCHILHLSHNHHVFYWRYHSHTYHTQSVKHKGIHKPDCQTTSKLVIIIIVFFTGCLSSTCHYHLSYIRLLLLSYEWLSLSQSCPFVLLELLNQFVQRVAHLFVTALHLCYCCHATCHHVFCMLHLFIHLYFIILRVSARSHHQACIFITEFAL